MASRPSKRRSGGSGAERTQTERVTFDDDDFTAFLAALYRRFPDEWIALAMGETDPATGLAQGEVLAHDISHAHVFDAGVAHRRAHPEIDVRFFTTAMGRI